MENEKKNALAKLTEQLGMFADFNRDADRVNGYIITKAKRIVAELAKVEVCKGADKFMPLDKPYDILDLANAAWNAIEIAEKGAGDGK